QLLATLGGGLPMLTAPAPTALVADGPSSPIPCLRFLFGQHASLGRLTDLIRLMHHEAQQEKGGTGEPFSSQSVQDWLNHVVSRAMNDPGFPYPSRPRILWWWAGYGSVSAELTDGTIDGLPEQARLRGLSEEPDIGLIYC